MSIYENQTGRLPRQSMLQHRYLIIGPAGRGGMSAVYRAVDTQSGGRHVAIKEMSQGRLDIDEITVAMERFEQEAGLLSSLHHPNLPRIFDAFSEGGRSFLVMDFIEGKNLLQVLQGNNMRPLPVAQVIDYALQLCNVLTFLHRHQPPIIFRDLKPTNVMVTESGHIYLIDFGIARLFKEGQLQDTVLLGSPGYAPPEQHGSAQTSPRSDLYALGATLHCCLTGKDPYLSNERFAFPPVRQYNELVPFELDQLIQSLVAVDERQRPTSALEVQQALMRIRQQASGDTMQVDRSSPVHAPTQYASPAPVSPAAFNSPYLAPQLPPTVAVSSSAAPPILPQRTTPDFGQGSPTPAKRGAAIWTAPFTILFILTLLITGGTSLFALNFINDSDHAVEFGLSVLLFLVVIGASIFVHKFIPLITLILGALGSLAAAVAFLILSAPPSLHLVERLGQFVSPANLFTAGLGAVAIVSLLWLTRPFTWLDRLALFVLFGGAAICLFVQYRFSDMNAPGGNQGDIKHTLLLIALIVLIQGVLLAARTERVHSHS